MILEVYITDFMCDAAIAPIAAVESLLAQFPALLKADWRVDPHAPLHTLFNRLHAGEKDSVSNTLAPALLLASAQPEKMTSEFCLLPVHLNLQRDSFSLHGTVALDEALYTLLTKALQQHFSSAFSLYADSGNRFWWVQPLTAIEAQSPWPQNHLFQHAFAWQPTGADAGLIRQWVNESQMLLHQIANSAQETWPASLNSLWFSKVMPLPEWQHGFDAVSGHGRLFAGLAASGLPSVQNVTIADLLNGHDRPRALYVADRIEDVAWQAISEAIHHGRLSELRLVVPFAERSIHIRLTHRQRWYFWRKTPTAEGLLQRLHAALLSQTSPPHLKS